MNIKNKMNSITFKTLLTIVIFSIAILLILWILQIGFLKLFYEKYTIKTMNTIKYQIENNNEYDLKTFLEKLAYQNNVCIEEYRENIVLYYNTKINNCQLGRNNQQIRIFQQNMINNNNINKLELTDPKFNTKSLLYGIKKNNSYIFIYTTLEDINSTTTVLKGQLIYITIIVMIISVFVAYFISKRISAPIIKISGKAKLLGEGNYNVRFEKNGINEIDKLADNLNFATEELGKTLELRRDLMANVGHDLRTPLTMIKAYAEMVKDYTYKDKEKRNNNLDVIIKETDRLNYLVNDIIDLSKLESNKDILNIEEFDLSAEIRDIIKRYDYLVEKENYNIIYCGDKKSIVKADKNKINQVIYNLINNAINYTGEDKTVTIKTKKEDNKVLVEVIDTGKGIKKEDIDYIWEKYYQSNKNHKRSKVGSGIGLSIVKEILTCHKFNYGVKSTEGKGTTFFFYINM